MDRLSPLRAAFVAAVFWGGILGACGIIEAHQKLEEPTEAAHVALIAAGVAGIRTYNERKESMEP